MGQSSSSRRPLRPEISKNTETVSPPLEDMDGPIRSIRVHPEYEFEVSNEKDISTQRTTASSSTPKGKKEKGKRLRVAFPFRRTPSGRWSRKKRTPFQNGIRSRPNPNNQIQMEMTELDQSWPVDNFEAQEGGSQSEAVSFHDNNGKKSESKGDNKPNLEPSKRNKGSQRSSGKKKKKEKESSKKDKKKNKKQSLRENIDVISENANQNSGDSELLEMKGKINGTSQEMVEEREGPIFNGTSQEMVEEREGPIFNGTSQEMVEEREGPIFNGTSQEMVEEREGPIFNGTSQEMVEEREGPIFNHEPEVDNKLSASRTTVEQAPKSYEILERQEDQDSSEQIVRHLNSPFTSFNATTIETDKLAVKLDPEQESKLDKLETESKLTEDITKETMNRAQNVTINSAVNSGIQSSELQILTSDIYAVTSNSTINSDIQSSELQILTSDIYAVTPNSTVNSDIQPELQILTSDIYAVTPNSTVNSDIQPELQILTSDIGAENANVLSTAERNYTSISTTTKFPVIKQTAAADFLHKESEAEVDELKLLSQNLCANNDTSRISHQNLDDKNDAAEILPQNFGVNFDTSGILPQTLDVSYDKYETLSQTLDVSYDKSEILSQILDTRANVSLRNVGSIHETLETTTENLDANMEALMYPGFGNDFADKDMDNMNRDSVSLEKEVTPKEEMLHEQSPSNNMAAILLQLETNHNCSDDFFHIKSENPQQMEAVSSDVKSFVSDEIQYEEIGVKRSHERNSLLLAIKNNEELVITTLDDIDGKTDYEDVEIKILAVQEVKGDPGNFELESDLMNIPQKENRNKKISSLEDKKMDKEKVEEKADDLQTMSIKERKNKKHGDEKTEKSTSEKLRNIPKKLSHWFHKKDDQKYVDSVGTFVDELVTDLNKDGQKYVGSGEIAVDELVTDLNKGDQVFESTLCYTEYASPDFTTSNSTFTKESNFTHKINKTPLAGTKSTESASSSDEHSTATSFSPVSPPVYSNRPTFATPNNEKSDGSSFLKKISLGSRLRTAILRKKSRDASDNSQEVKRISLTQPKTVKFTDSTTPPSKNLHTAEPENLHSSINEGTSNALFSINTSTHSPVDKNITVHASYTEECKSFDANFNNICIAGQTSPVEVKSTEPLQDNPCTDRGTKETVFEQVYCVHVSASDDRLVDDISDVKENPESVITNSILPDGEGEQCSPLDPLANTALSEHKIEVDADKTALSEHKMEVDTDKTALSEYKMEVDAEKTALTEHKMEADADKTAFIESNIDFDNFEAALFKQNNGLERDKTAFCEHNVEINSDEAIFSEQNIGISKNKTAFYEPILGREVDKSAMSGKVVVNCDDNTVLGLDIDQNTVIAPELGAKSTICTAHLESPEALSAELILPDFLKSEISEQTTLQQAVLARMSQLDMSMDDKNNGATIEFQAEGENIPKLANSKILCTSTTSVDELFCPLSSMSVPSLVTDYNIGAHIQQTPFEISASSSLSGDEYKHEQLEKPRIFDVNDTQITSLPEILLSSHNIQHLQKNSDDYNSCSEYHQSKILIQRDYYFPPRTIAEYQIGMTSDLLEDQPGLSEIKENQIAMYSDFQTTNDDRDHLSTSAIKETTAVSVKHQTNGEEKHEFFVDNLSIGTLLICESSSINNSCFNGDQERIKLCQNTSISSPDIINHFQIEDTENTGQTQIDEMTCEHKARSKNGIDSHFTCEMNGCGCEVLLGSSKNVNHIKTSNHQNGINGKVETIGSSCVNLANNLLSCDEHEDSQKEMTNCSLKFLYSNSSNIIECSQHERSSVTKNKKKMNSNTESADM